MRHIKNLIVPLIALLIALASCGKEETILEIIITEHPLGGMNVESLDCTFEGEIISGDDPVQVTIEWWWEDENGVYGGIVETDYCEFDEQYPVTYTTNHRASLGYVFVGYFWVSLSWTDDEGMSRIESAKGFCGYD